MQLIILIIFIYAAKSAWEDAHKAWRTSKTSYMKSADARFPGAPKSRRAAWALRHDAGYWAAQAAQAFPTARHGLAAGWHEGRAAQADARAAREEARTRRLENQAGHAERLSGFRERQQEALRRWRDAMNADRERTTEGTVTGEGSAGSGEGSAPPPADGRTYSWGAAASPYGWPAKGDADKAHHYARRMSEGGNPQVVTEYPPEGGPGTTAATYLNGEEIQPVAEQVAAWAAEAEETRRRYPGPFDPGPGESPLSPEYIDEVDSLRNSFEFQNCESCGGDWAEHEIVPDVLGHARAVCHPANCYLCGLPLAGGGETDGLAHERCSDLYLKDAEAHMFVNDEHRELEDVERDLRDQGRCPHQGRGHGHDGTDTYCGQPLGGNDGDEWCPFHEAEASGDEDEAADELNAHVRALLEADQQESPAPAQAAPSTQGEPAMSGDSVTGTIGANNAEVRQYNDVARNAGGVMPAGSSDVTYDGVLKSMAAEQASAEQRAAEQQQAVTRASAMADQMQGLEVDSATLSAMADHLDAQDAASKAQARVLETAAAVDATLRRGHAGLAEAHQSAPVQSATREFYQN